MVLAKRAKEVSAAETPDSFGTVQAYSVLGRCLLQPAKHLFDRTACLFQIECLENIFGINILDC